MRIERSPTDSGTTLRRMSRKIRKKPAVAAAAVLAVAAAGVPLVLMAGDEGAKLPPRTAPAGLSVRPVSDQSAVGTAARPITLATGDTLRMESVPGGRTVVTPQPASSLSKAAPAMAVFTVGGDTYAVPSKAVPYLGKQLDPSLFDVSYLRRAGFAGQSKLPVSVEWNDEKHTPVPGVDTSGSGPKTAGTISAEGARDFGEALASDGAATLRGVKKLSLAAPAITGLAAGPAAGRSQQGVPGAVPLSGPAVVKGARAHTLTVVQRNRAGEEGIAIIAVQNLETFTKFYNIMAVAPGNGPLSFTVPDGPYGIESFIYDLNEANLVENLAFVPAEVTVSDDTVVTLDAREAQPIDVTVPHKDAAVMWGSQQFTRTSADGAGIEAVMGALGPAPLASGIPPVRFFAKPIPASKKGALSYAHAWRFLPPETGVGGVPQEYSYLLDFPSANGVPAALLTQHLTRANLAVDHTRVGAVLPDDGFQDTMSVFHPWSRFSWGFGNAFLLPVPGPLERDDYYNGSPTSIWSRAVQSIPAAYDNGMKGYVPVIFAAPRTFRAGEEVTSTWANGPSVPAPEWQDQSIPAGSKATYGVARSTYAYACPVCRQGDVVQFNVVPAGDLDPTHTSGVYGTITLAMRATNGSATSQITFYRNGRKVQTGIQPGQLFPMLPGTARYRIESASTVPAEMMPLGTRVDSAWDFTSTTPAEADRLPAYEQCAPDPNQKCSYVPLIFASYDFGADLRGQVTSGEHTFTVGGYYQQGVTGRTVTKASVQMSYDDGATWTPVPVKALGGGKFQVSANNPAPSGSAGYASVKVNLSDSAGDSFEQTVIHAYAVVGA